MLFFILFVLSLLANSFEIFGFFRERRKYKEEQKQRKQDEERLKVYEYLFDTAEKSISSKNELETLKEEIGKKENVLPELERRIELLRLAAKKEIVEQNISRTINDLRNSRDELNKLLQLQNELGELPDLPAAEKENIKNILSNNVRKPFELPKEITYKAILLVLIVLLLPSPADELIVVVLLGLFLTTFFQIASYSEEDKVRNWILKNYKIIGFLSSFGVWFYLLREIQYTFGRPLELIIEMNTRPILKNRGTNSNFFLEYFLGRSYLISEIIILIIALIIAQIQWSNIKASIIGIINNSKVNRN